MKRIEWTAPAEADLATIDSYLSSYSVAVAEGMLDRIERAGNFLAERPYAGHPLRDTRIRKWTVAKTRYLLLYRIKEDEVQILRIRHAAEDWRTDAE